MKMSKLSLVLGAALLAACTPAPPACQTAAGAFAKLHHMRPVSLSCANERGGETPCTLAYLIPGEPGAVDVVSLLCSDRGCACVGGCR